MKGKTPVTQTKPQAQQPTPPVSRIAPVMANPAPVHVHTLVHLGTVLLGLLSVMQHR
jgi:hypothetical protein